MKGRLGESAARAAARETLEETSLRVSLRGEEEDDDDERVEVGAVALSVPAAAARGAGGVVWEFREGPVLESGASDDDDVTDDVISVLEESHASDDVIRASVSCEC